MGLFNTKTRATMVQVVPAATADEPGRVRVHAVGHPYNGEPARDIWFYSTGDYSDIAEGSDFYITGTVYKWETRWGVRLGIVSRRKAPHEMAR